MSWFKQATIIGMSLEEIKRRIENGENLYLRFVRVNGEYRFADTDGDYPLSHKFLAQEQPAETAGFVKIYPDGFYTEGYSMGLSIGPDEHDEDNLKMLFNLPIKDRPW